MESNIQEQIDEIMALISIYGDEWKAEPESDCYSVDINPNVKIFIKLNENYPLTACPSYELLAPTLTQQQKEQITADFNNIYMENKGSPILFQWIEKLKEIAGNSESRVEDVHKENQQVVEPIQVFDLDVYHGSTIQDRKSVFQGHCCRVKTIEDVRSFKDHLLTNKKIAQATHNISAYRIVLKNGTVLQDCDDDGEGHAGGRVLHLLQILNSTNVVVVVSRWYGGIQLGPDRFKHINNAARQVLAQANFIQS